MDFRAKLKDGSYELVEAKGMEMPDYIIKRRLIEAVYLHQHPDHTYIVIKRDKNWKPRK